MGGSSFQESYQCLPASDLPLASLRRSVEYGGKGAGALFVAPASNSPCCRL